MQPLPIGRRTGLADPRGIGTAAPLTKVLGEPADLLTESVKVPIQRVISPFKPLANKPLGAFEVTFGGTEIPDLGFTDRAKQRIETEQLDREMRVRAAPKFVLGRGRVSGWDWIRSERRRRPNLPAGYLGSVAVTRPFAERGVQSQQLEMPILTTDALANEGSRTSVMGPASLPPNLPGGLTVQLETPAASPDPARPSSFQWGYLIVAGVIAFLILRRA